MKRGQISLFIIIGIVILLGVSAFSYFTFNNQTESYVYEDIKPVVVLVNDCLEESATAAIMQATFMGGVSEDPNFKYVMFADLNMPVYYDLGIMNFPDVSVFENSINKKTKELIQSCINFDSNEYVVEIKEEPEIKTISAINSVDLEMIYPLDITINNKVQSIQNFKVNVPIALSEKYKVIETIVYGQGVIPNEVYLSNLIELGAIHNFKYKLTYEEDAVLHTIVFNDETTMNIPLVFNFVVQYNWAGEEQ